jgi:AcrR family transcriptional regulator
MLCRLSSVGATLIGEPANARSRRTRAALLDAARDLIESEGYAALDMAAVAVRAGVTRRAVYLHFATRTDLVAALFNHVSGVEHLTASLQPVWDAPDAQTAVRAWTKHLARFNQRVLAVDRATLTAAEIDADAARHRAQVTEDQRAAARRLAARLADEAVLAPPWTEETAADLIWVLMRPDSFGLLTGDCAWNPTQYSERLALVLESTLLRQGLAAAG